MAARTLARATRKCASMGLHEGLNAMSSGLFCLRLLEQLESVAIACAQMHATRGRPSRRHRCIQLLLFAVGQATTTTLSSSPPSSVSSLNLQPVVDCRSESLWGRDSLSRADALGGGGPCISRWSPSALAALEGLPSSFLGEHLPKTLANVIVLNASRAWYFTPQVRVC